MFLTSLAVAMLAPAAGARIIEGVVVCEGCPARPIHVMAYPAVDRYNWPWWEVYGFLRGFHSLEALDAMRPSPLATTTVSAPGPFQLETGDVPAFVFARLDGHGGGALAGPRESDWIGRFPRNPVDSATRGALEIALYPLVWSRDYERDRYQPAGGGAFRFTDVTEASGLRFRHCQGGDIGHLPVVVGSGALLDDLDGDRDLDLFVVQGLGECPGAEPESRLYANVGGGGFLDVTAGSGIALRATGMGVAGADYDRDGDLDLLVTTLQGARLLRNDGGLRFADVTAASGIEVDDTWTIAATFGDVDGDGWLDLYIANYVDFSLAPPFTPDAEIPAFVAPMLSSPFAFPPAGKDLYRNLGNGRFVLTPDALGASNREGKGMGAILADLDRDGDPDLYVTNDCTSDRLFENRGGRFKDISRIAGVDDISSGMGIAMGDVDGDGRPDLFSPHWLNEPPVFYRGLGRLRFAEATAAAGLSSSGNGMTGWAAEFADLDADGALDLLVTHGHTHPGRQPTTLEPQFLQLFRGQGSGHFEDQSCDLAAALPEPEVWRGMAQGDVDGDGDLDVYLVAWNGRGRLLRNDSSGGHWLNVGLTRASGERGAIGARVAVVAAGRRIERDVVSGTSYLSHSSLELEFGLGRARSMTSLEVAWPGGAMESFPPPGVDQRIELIEGGGAAVGGR